MAGAMSKGFFEFVKSIGESKSYQEESRIVENEMTTLKERMSAKSVDDRQMREYIIRMVKSKNWTKMRFFFPKNIFHTKYCQNPKAPHPDDSMWIFLQKCLLI